MRRIWNVIADCTSAAYVYSSHITPWRRGGCQTKHLHRWLFFLVLVISATTAGTWQAVAQEDGEGRRGNREPAEASPDAAQPPAWIWSSADRQPDQRTVLYRDLILPPGISGARVRIATDFARCQLMINDRLKLDLDAYGPWSEVDVTDSVRTGSNRVQLRVNSVDGPAAVAFCLTADTATGTQVLLVSDGHWQWRAADVDDAPTGSAANRADGQPVVCLGRVARHVWDASAGITAIDDYTQWKRADGSHQQADPATFATLPGFVVDLLHTAQPEEGSWVSMAVDSQSRLTIAREDQGLLRLTLAPGGNRVEVIDDTLQECRGLLYAHDSLYANANGSKGLYRLRDTTGDDRFDQVTLLRSWPGGEGHGRNDLALGPDGSIYAIHGDSVDLPAEQVTDYTSPLRGARRDRPSREGHLLRTDADGERWQLVASGLRNPFGIDFNADGELFTYDADAEFDMGTPWYRCTRIVHLVTGGDYGWRGETGQWPPYRLDHADNALPAGDVGKGSPTAVKSARRSGFPFPYRDALLALDWAYGRVLACHLQPRGGGYRCHVETFLQGRPLNVTDLDFGPDGEMYVITGGRKTQSALYRIRYVGEPVVAPEPTVQQQARETFSDRRRQLRRRLEAMVQSPDPLQVGAAWPHLRDDDPAIRYAARLVVEHVAVDQWAEQALAEPDARIAVTALLALARSGHEWQQEAVIARLNRLPLDQLSPYDQLALLQAYRLCLGDRHALPARLLAETRDRVQQWMRAVSEAEMLGPTGAGNPILRGVGLLAVELQIDGLVPMLMSQLAAAKSQEDRLHWLFALRTVEQGWTLAQRRDYFNALADLERTAVGGEGMPATLTRIRSEAVATLAAAETEALGPLVQPAGAADPRPLAVARPEVRQWRVDDVPELLRSSDATNDVSRGALLFDQVLCSQCHRMGDRGGMVGPDLTSVASRFSRGDMLKSILAPSDVVAPPYRGVQVLTHSGNVVTGRVVTGGDFRAPSVRIASDPMRPYHFVEIAKSDIQWHRPSDRSPMPEGLLNTLTAAEIGDLLAYLESGGVTR